MDNQKFKTGDVFISYRHDNADLVAQVEEELKHRGISYFIDRFGIKTGMEYGKIIVEAIDACKLLLLFWTPEVKDSKDIVKEVIAADGNNKHIIPYQIGNFNPREHKDLHHHIGSLSAYKVPRQTPETIKTIVDKVQQFLMPVILPEKSADAFIQEPQIENIDVEVKPITVEQPVIEVNRAKLPPLPEDIISLQAENKGQENAVEQLEALTHDSLAQANSAVAMAQAQYDAWNKRKEESWKDMSPEWRQSLEKTIADNPDCTEGDIQISTDDMSNQEYVGFLELFQCGKKCEQARLALIRGQNLRQEKVSEAVNKLRRDIDYNNSQLNILGKHFLDKVLTVILTLMPGYDAVDAGFPEGSILQPLLLLDDYNLNWKIKEEMQRARELWKQERPCVFADQEERKKAMLLPGTFAGERKTVVIQNVEFTFRWCPAGTFRMGSPITEDWREKNEKRHRVILSKGFWMMETPVTQEQWQAVTKDNPSHFKGENHPVESVSWNDSQRFCKKCEQLGIPVQLPTEAQWEYACRAGSIGPLAGGLREMAWYDDNSSSQTHPVGQKKANAWGLYDMHGNVWEWCEDRYGDYPSEERSDPTGSATGDERVARGGSYNNNYKYCRSAYRNKFIPESIYRNVGLRCAITVDSKAVKSLPDAQNAGSQEPQPKIDAGTRKVFAVKDVEFAFRWCPAGTFMMGSPDSETGRNRNEVLHQVTLTRGFWMMETEVTQKQWSAVMPTNPSKFVNDDQPVESISWDDCQLFCKKCAELGLSLQLPTEAQWEYACRAGCTEAHFGSVDEISWHSSNSRKTTHPVGSMEPNAWGIYDMHGNVWEWCADWFENYPDGNVTDPVGPDSGFDRVKRGGSWFNDASRSRAAYRSHSIPSSKDSIIGFRCVKVQ